MRMQQFWAVSVSALLLAACGGGGATDTPQGADPLAAVPPSAGQSTPALMDYLGSLPPLDAEMREPVSLDAFVPPTSETDEPQDLGG